MKSRHLAGSTAHNKAAYIAAQHDYLQRVAKHCDYAITLQTSLRTCGIKARTMEDRLYKAQASVRQLRNRLNRLLTGNGYKRNAAYLPLFVAAIEGTTNDYDLNRTLHIHIALGNTGHTANEDTRRLLEDGIRQIWTQTEVGTADVRVDRLTEGTEQRWMDYIGKEAYVSKTGSTGNIGVIDYSNTQIPAHLLDD
jgi:hypothetical protein